MHIDVELVGHVANIRQASHRIGIAGGNDSGWETAKLLAIGDRRQVRGRADPGHLHGLRLRGEHTRGHRIGLRATVVEPQRIVKGPIAAALNIIVVSFGGQGKIEMRLRQFVSKAMCPLRPTRGQV